MKLAVVLLLCFGFYSIQGTPAVSRNVHNSRPSSKVVTKGGEDPDPEIRVRREFVKQVSKKRQTGCKK